MEMTKEEQEEIFQGLVKEHLLLFKMKELLKLLQLYDRKREYLETMDTSLDIVKMVLEDDITNNEKLRLVHTVRTIFGDKLYAIREEIQQIILNNAEVFDDIQF